VIRATIGADASRHGGGLGWDGVGSNRMMNTGSRGVMLFLHAFVRSAWPLDRRGARCRTRPDVLIFLNSASRMRHGVSAFSRTDGGVLRARRRLAVFRGSVGAHRGCEKPALVGAAGGPLTGPRLEMLLLGGGRAEHHGSRPRGSGPERGYRHSSLRAPVGGRYGPRRWRIFCNWGPTWARSMQLGGLSSANVSAMGGVLDPQSPQTANAVFLEHKGEAVAMASRGHAAALQAVSILPGRQIPGWGTCGAKGSQPRPDCRRVKRY